jgi:hypothetical protein
MRDGLIKPIGGEADRKQDTLHSYLTDSGRSSLRLIIESGFRDKRFLIPDYLCKVIPELLGRLGVAYSFYRVGPDLSVDLDSVRGQDFDVLYLIDFFGQGHPDYRKLLGSDAWIIEDAVFLPDAEPPENARNWIGFNSFRKISRLADGSIVRSTTPLSSELILAGEAKFQAIKAEAKRLKYEYLHANRGTEERYLELFCEAEAMIDRQESIHRISGSGLFGLLAFYRGMEAEYRTRAANFRLLEEELGPLSLGIRATYPSFFVLAVDRRDDLRKHLFARRIFLPVHWPRASAPHNTLYDRTISIPVDSRYDENDVRRISRTVREFYEGPSS